MSEAVPSFLALLALLPLATAVGAQEQRPAPEPVGPDAPPAHDRGWYPYPWATDGPPFVADTLRDEGELVDSPDVVWAGSGVLAVEDEPVLPAGLEKPLFRSGRFVPGYFVVHFEADVRPEDKRIVDALTGPVRRADGSELARWYVPNNSLVAWVDDPLELEALEATDRVDMVARYQPAYKLDPTIGSVPLTSPERVGRAFYRLDLDLVPGHPAELVVRELTALGVGVLGTVYIRGEKTYDVHFVVVDALPFQVTQIAHVEGIRTIQERGDGKAVYDISGGGKLQNRTLNVDNGNASPIVTASRFPLWVTHDLQGQGQAIGVVDTSMDWNNSSMSGCNFGFPDTNIDNWGFANPVAATALLSIGAGGVSLKVPRADELGGATLLGNGGNQHGVAAAGAAVADFYGNNENKWWEHDVDNWESWSPTNFSGLLGPGIAHEAQLYFTPVDDNNGNFRWEFIGEFESNMNTTLDNMAAAGVCVTSHSVGLAEASNTYTQTTVVHDTNGFDHPEMLQFMAAGNSGATSNALTSQAVAKNGVAVGASDDVLKPEDRVTFSSIGPAFDGRIKPDVMAPGSDTAPRASGVQSLLILPDANGSSAAGCEYQWTAGTSFSSPIAAGAGALVHQYYQEGRLPGFNDASAALIKASLINAGHKLTGANLGNTTYPNAYQGWGEPNLSDVLDFGTGSRRLIAHDVSSAQGFTGGGNPNDNYSVTVNGGSEGLRVTLVWTDEPGGTGVGKKLINDLHLIVTAPGGAQYKGNVFNSSGTSVTGGSADTLNNVERVILNNPATGTWNVAVDPGPGNYSVGQGYALVVNGDVSSGAGPGAPVAEFSGSPTGGTAPLNVNFTDLSTGSVTSWSWSFGDGGSSTAQNPSHVYNAAGTYNVSLTATGPGGSDIETKVGYVTVGDPAPTANFSGSPTSGTAPLTVNFTDLSSGNITSRAWTFGDGGTSGAVNPSHVYNAAGTYTVSLTVAGPGGSDIETKVGYVTVSDSPSTPTADFSGSPTSGTAPLTVNFTDQSTGTVTAWFWSFGDGVTSFAQHPAHTYTAPGTYDVSLTASGPGGLDVETKVGYVTVGDTPSGGVYYLSFLSTTTVPGVGTVRDEDVVTYDPATGTWALYFDGSDVGLGSYDVNAVHVLSDGDLVLSFWNSSITIPGLTGGPGGSTTIDDSDLVIFSFASSGPNTTGSFSFVFDGSDVGLANNGEDIDGVYEFPAGGLAISTTGGVWANGVSSARDEDVLFFTPTQFGKTTSGTFSLYFDGSDVGFASSSSEDLTALTFEGGVDLLFSTVGSYSAAGGSGADEDVSRFSGVFGSATSGSASLELDLSALGIDPAEDVDALSFVE